MGVSPASINFANCTLESDKFVCIREQAGDNVQISIVEMGAVPQINRRPIKADSALMNPVAKVLALKAAQSLQIFNIELRSKLKSFEMPEPVVFWKWISSSTLALVTQTAVFHWSMDGTSEPIRMFERHPNLAACQIINYRADPAEKWLILIGIAQVDGRIAGSMQLYSVEKKVSQPIEGHAAAFALFKVPGSSAPSTLFTFAVRGAAGAKLHIIEVQKGSEAAPPYGKKAVDMFFPPDSANDFPVAMQVSDKYGVVYVITKNGLIYLYDVETGASIYTNRLSATPQDTIFVTCPNTAATGLVGINRKGQVLNVTLDEANVVPFLMASSNAELAMKIAARGNLPGGDTLYVQQFDALLRQGKVQEAAQLAAHSPGGVLRNAATIQKLQSIPVPPGQLSPLLQYFQTLLEGGKLNALESVELVRPVIQSGKIQLLEKWLKEDKLECSEELGDLVRPMQPQMATSIYIRANAHPKVIQCFVETGMFDKILLYANKVNYRAEWIQFLPNIVMRNPQAAVDFALVLANNEAGPLVDFGAVVDIFMQRNLVQQATAFLLDVLKRNRPEDGALQTRLFEITVMASPQVADAILANGQLTYYDRHRVAQLCEKGGLFQRALEHYHELDDIRRVIVNTHVMAPDFLLAYFGNMSADWAIECMRDLLKNVRQNLQMVVQIAIKYSEEMTPAALIALFEDAKAPEGLFMYLAAIVNFSQDPEVHFKYIVAASKVGQSRKDFKEVERITRESSFYPPERTKDFLKEAKLPDATPLINVCDKFNFVEELTVYLYQNQMFKYVELFVQKMNPTRTPEVVGALLDCGCSEDAVRNLVLSVRNLCPVVPLVEVCEARNRLKLITPWLEQRLDEGSEEPALHNALAKVYIDTSQNPEKFLENNKFYDSRVVGKYCEKRDPHLSVIAYRRGHCDDELVEVTNKNNLFKSQARYLVERQDLDLWAKVLSDENTFRGQLVDQVVHTALPETKNAEEVSTTVKAFMNADLPSALIELLEKIVLQGSEFSSNRNLQNLLILTAVKADPSRVMDYINRLDKFDGPEIANICVSSELYEEAFVIFKKNGLKVEAISVLLDNISSLERGVDFAKQCDDPQVWSTLARAQLNANIIGAAIDSYVKAQDPSNFREVIGTAEREEAYEDLIRFLVMARKKVKDSLIDTTVIFAYARTNRLSELEEFISGPNVAQVQVVGDQCFDSGFFEAARLLFSNIGNFARLASALVRLKRYQEAVEAARKASYTKTWKEVLEACVDAKEFRLAQMCGLNIITVADEIEEVIRTYEVRGFFDELIHLMESGLGLELGGSSAGLFTELAILYARYRADKLMEHLKLFHSRLNIPRVIREAEKHAHWAGEIGEGG